MQEIEKLHRRAELIKSYQQDVAANEGYTVRFEAWLVTNTATIEEAAAAIAKKARIALKVTELPGNWRDQADWPIINIHPMDGK